MKNWRDDAVQAGGLVGAGVVGALIAVLANAIYRGEADGGDWLQFFGGMIGAALAVSGAVFFDKVKERRSRTNEILDLAAMYSGIIEYLDNFDGDMSDYSTVDAISYQAEASHFQDRINAMMFYIEIANLKLITDIDLLRKITWSKSQFKYSSEALEKFITEEANAESDISDFKDRFDSSVRMKNFIVINCKSIEKGLRDLANRNRK